MDSYERAKHILKTHAKEHKALAEALLKYETLDAEDIKAIMADRQPNIDKAQSYSNGGAVLMTVISISTYIPAVKFN